MRAGRLREVITIESYTESQGDFGEPERTWSTLATRRAEVIPILTDPESEQGGKMEGRSLFKFTVRHIPNLNQRARIVWRNETYEIIEAIDTRARNREHVIKAAING